VQTTIRVAAISRDQLVVIHECCVDSGVACCSLVDWC